MDILTTADIINDALRKAGEKTDGTSDYVNDALGYLNTFYRAILAGGNEFNVDLGEPWTWAKSKYPGVLTLVPEVNPSGLTLTQGSANGTFAVAPTDSLVNWFVRLENGPEMYRVLTHVAGDTAFVMDGPFNGDSGSGIAAKLIKLDYDLNATNILRQIGPMNVYRRQTSDGDMEGKIYGLDFRSMAKNNPLFDVRRGVPTQFANLHEANGIVTVRFNKYVAELTRVEYDYIETPTPLTNDSSSIPLVPAAHRECLSYAVAHAICVDKEDTKATTFFQLAAQKLQAMCAANRREFMQISKNRGRLIPRMSDFGGRNWPIAEK